MAEVFGTLPLDGWRPRHATRAAREPRSPAERSHIGNGTSSRCGGGVLLRCARLTSNAVTVAVRCCWWTHVGWNDHVNDTSAGVLSLPRATSSTVKSTAMD